MKKFLSLSLALILCVALSVPAFAANYTSYTWSDEYTTMKFDAAAVATETIKAWDYDSEEYTNQNVTMITVKPGSSVTVTGDSMFTLSELTEDGYGVDYMGAEIKTGAVDDIFTNFPAGALFVVEYGKTYTMEYNANNADFGVRFVGYNNAGIVTETKNIIAVFIIKCLIINEAVTKHESSEVMRNIGF